MEAADNSMIDLPSALLVFALLGLSAALGMFVSQRLPASHRGRETVEMMALVIGMLVTFAALVLGLLTASVKSGYDDAVHNREEYALQLTQLDQCLRDYGPRADAARLNLKSYTAAVIASVWPSEPPPKGISYPDTSRMPRLGSVPALADLMNRTGLDIINLISADPDRMHLAEDCELGARLRNSFYGHVGSAL